LQEKIPVTAFKDLWQEQRRLRQEEVALRKQQVRDTLTSFEQDRKVMASQLRDDLNLFQVELQHETQVFLANVSQQRQIQAEQVSQLLRDFVQVLQYQTAEFLAASAADRSLMAEQLFQDLSQFHARLITSVATLRQTLQVRVQEIQAETQELLLVSREQRLQVKEQLVQELTAFVEGLRGDVQRYLSELELVRQDRAQRLHQMLQLDRERRLSEVDAMFHELTEFRSELKQYCINLRSLVWGGGESQVESAPQTAQLQPPSRTQSRVTPVTATSKPANTKPVAASSPVATVPPQARLATSKPQPVPVSTSQPARAPQPVVTKVPVASVPAPPVTPTPVAPIPVAPAPVTPTPVAPVAVASESTPTPVPQPVVEVPVVAQPIATQPEVVPVTTHTSPKPVQLDPVELEKEIYNHVHRVQGARLTELESALGINRFQAVDALRALIKKGLITQRDRIYLIQEDISL
jgi:Gas vesicles protein GVPc repeated domain